MVNSELFNSTDYNSVLNEIDISDDNMSMYSNDEIYFSDEDNLIHVHNKCESPIEFQVHAPFYVHNIYKKQKIQKNAVRCNKIRKYKINAVRWKEKYGNKNKNIVRCKNI